jgi:hypothetical protein
VERKHQDKGQVEGEGSYTGTRDYNQRTKKFVESGKVEQAAEDAKPDSEQEAREMQQAERIGKQKAKK